MILTKIISRFSVEFCGQHLRTDKNCVFLMPYTIFFKCLENNTPTRLDVYNKIDKNIHTI